MATDEAPHTIGSDAWLGAGEYDPESVFYRRASSFFKTVNWDALATAAARHRGGISCGFAENFSVGHFNMARRLNFVDGVSWVARVRLPELELPEFASAREALPDSKVMEIEVASMKFFRMKTPFPVPEVHAYSSSAENEVGAPYILMDYIHGTVTHELQTQIGSPCDQFGTVEQDRKFREQMARIQATVASFRFREIGSLYYNEDTNEFYIGPELQTGLGPWTSSEKYYDDVARHLLKSTTQDHLRESQSFMLPTTLSFLLRICGEEKNGPFRLVDRDFGVHNILVNEEFEIVGLIDFPGIMAAPLEVVAQYPLFCGLDPEKPGVVETHPIVVERVAKTLPRLKDYKDMLARCEGHVTGSSKIADCLEAISASAYRGLRNYEGGQHFVNDAWMKSCLKMLQDQV